MMDSHMPHPPARSPFVAVRWLAAALSLALALSAGCGGNKPDAAPAGTSTVTPPPAVTPTPAETTSAGANATAPPVVAGDLGTQVFVKRCVLCHGADGRGDGIASKGLKPAPRNFHDAAYMNSRTDAQLLEVMHKGKGVMPRWEGQLTEAEFAALLAHIRKLGTTP